MRPPPRVASTNTVGNAKSTFSVPDANPTRLAVTVLDARPLERSTALPAPDFNVTEPGSIVPLEARSATTSLSIGPALSTSILICVVSRPNPRIGLFTAVTRISGRWIPTADRLAHWIERRHRPTR